MKVERLEILLKDGATLEIEMTDQFYELISKRYNTPKNLINKQQIVAFVKESVRKAVENAESNVDIIESDK